MARTRASCNPLPPEGCWIQFRLNLLNVKQDDVAKKAKRSIGLVSKVICGERNSEAVGAALAQILGYPSYKELMQAARRSAKEWAA